uniref:Hydroxymethylglutaryl-CoA reductase (NADPH) n=1 Tax=Panagrolaimus sp. JU765 TaxID=591449 RepID=A0AC34R225_9BILA
MNCLEVGTVGGGTILQAQQSMLDMLGCRGSNVAEPGANARRLAKIICAAVVAGEVSLLAALDNDDLVKSHMTMNRSKLDLHSASDSAFIRQHLAINSIPTVPKSTANLSTPTTRIQNKNSGLVVVDKVVKKMKHSDCFHLV